LEPTTKTLAQNSQQLLATGEVHNLCSRTCSPQRGGLISILQALQHTIKTVSSRHNRPKDFTLIICSRDSKLLKALHKCKEPTQNATTMLRAEQGLIEEITPLMKQFRLYKTHHSTKKDRPNSTEKYVMDTCIANVQKGSHTTITKYSPKGLATVWLAKHEVSSEIKHTIRLAAQSTDLYQYLQTKYKWEGSTIDHIDWLVHGQSLQNLTTNQRKTITQLIHEWLPVNGHPGRALHQSSQHCTTCRSLVETQGHLLTCPNTLEQWNIRFQKITEPLQATYPILTSILKWALINCQDNTTEIPNAIPNANYEDIHPHYTNLIQAQPDIGWEQIIKGRWATHWVQHIELITPDQGGKIMTKLTTEIWHTCLTM
jgi:hypothetical protein